MWTGRVSDWFNESEHRKRNNETESKRLRPAAVRRSRPQLYMCGLNSRLGDKDRRVKERDAGLKEAELQHYMTSRHDSSVAN